MPRADWTNEQFLLSEFRKGNLEALEYIYTLNHRVMWLMASKLVNDPDEAEDIVADAFVKLWNRRESFEESTNISAYLTTITRNACLDHLKHKKRKALSESEMAYLSDTGEDFIEANIVKAEFMKQTLSYMNSMPEGMKEIFKLLFVDGLSHQEVAQKLNLSADTVRGQKARALKILRHAFRLKGPFVLIITGLGAKFFSLIIKQLG